MKFISCLLLIFLVLIYSSCFSPWQGEKEGTLTIHLPGSSAHRAVSAARSVVTDEEAAELQYNLMFTSPGRTAIEHSVSPGQPSFTIAIVPGEWTVTVKGYGKKNGSQNETEIVLRAMGTTEVIVTAGQENHAVVSMVTVTEVESWDELWQAVGGNTQEGYENREEYIIVKNDLIATNEAMITRKITILTDNRQPVKITRSPDFGWEFFNLIEGGELTLGEKGCAPDTLILDGNAEEMDVKVTLSLITVDDGAEFIMNDGVTLQNNEITYIVDDRSYGGGVTMNGGTFTMNGGKIFGNSAVIGGGGVELNAGENATIIFTMEGGSITGNTTDGDGGGVNLVGGTFGEITFDMQGGIISYNTAGGKGGGVFVGLGRTFQRTDAKTTIENNTSSIGENDNVFRDEEVFPPKTSVKVASWADLLAAVADSQYESIIVENDFTIASTDETAVIKRNVTISAANGKNVTISRGPGFSYEFFSVDLGENESIGNLILGKEDSPDGTSLVLDGKEISAYASLVTVSSGAKFVMNDGVTLKNNLERSGVTVYSGTFTMNGGNITGNSNLSGGGVYVGSGTFEMSGGSVSKNEAPSGGGGVYIASSGAVFRMSGGSVSENESSTDGGGVFVYNGTFDMDGDAHIFDNITSDRGGGVYVGDGIFNMKGGVIGGEGKGNEAGSSGGGVFIIKNPGSSTDIVFTMEGGTISGNTAADAGGGVWSSGVFTMTDGEISGNTVSSSSSGAKGGGVYIDGTTASTEFIKTGGIIYGEDVNEANVAESGKGHAVYVERPEPSNSKWENATVSNDLAYSGGMFGEGWGFNVTFTADGGTPVPDSVSVNYGSKISEPAAMSKTGYIFAGWYKEAALTNEWDFDNDTVSGDTILYAKWTLNQHQVTITIEPDLEEKYFVEEPSEPISGDSLIIKIKEGYTVDTWYLDGVQQFYIAGEDVEIKGINPGIHHVKIIARNNDSNIPYSNDITITVE